MYYESFQDMGSEEKAQREWFLKLTSLTAGEFVSLTGPSALRVMVAALSQIQKNGGTADAAGCVEGLCIASAQGAAAPAALRVMVSPCGVQRTHFVLCELDL